MIRVLDKSYISFYSLNISPFNWTLNWRESVLICHNCLSLQCMEILCIFLCLLLSWSLASLDASSPLRFLFFFECYFTIFLGNLLPFFFFQNRCKTFFSLKLEEMVTYLALQRCHIGNSKLDKTNKFMYLSMTYSSVLIWNFIVFELAQTSKVFW